MNSSHKAGRIIQGAIAEGDVFVLGRSARRDLAAPSAVVDAIAVISAAEDRGRSLAREAEAELEAARAEAAGIREAARQDGLAAGRAEGLQAGSQAAIEEMTAYVELLRDAAAQGKAVRDDVAAESTALIARAAMLVARRIIGEHYQADPAATVGACADAIRAASGQTIISIRVNPVAADDVRAALVDHAAYVRPDGAVEIGGCLIDLREGIIDATLDARLQLMELALGRAAGEPAQ